MHPAVLLSHRQLYVFLVLESVHKETIAKAMAAIFALKPCHVSSMAIAPAKRPPLPLIHNILSVVCHHSSQSN